MLLVYYALIFGSVIFNESVYPSTYLFGGPDKVLMRSNVSTTNTDARTYYLDCRCSDGVQVVDAFGFEDAIAQDVSYQLRYLFAFELVYVALRYAFKLPFRWAFGLVVLYGTLGSMLMLAVQDASCAYVRACGDEFESVWDRRMWLSLLVLTQFARGLYFCTRKSDGGPDAERRKRFYV